MRELRCQFFVTITLSFLVAGCASHEIVPPEIDRPPGAIKEDGSPLFRQAEKFDRLIRQVLPPEELETFRASCQTEPHPFCYSLNHWSALQDVINDKFRKRTPVESKPLAPISPEFKNGKVTNWNALRKGKVQAILKGLLSLNNPQLTPLVSKAKAEKRCPNNIAVALAATLEDYLPDGTKPKDLAGLYAQGGRCSRREPVDREHFYTRAGILSYVAKDYPSAIKYLKAVTPQDAYVGRALYWLYRTQKASGQTKAAADTAKRVRDRHPFSFHSLLIAMNENQDPLTEIPETGKEWRARSISNPKVNPVTEQVEILHRYGFDPSAAILADWALTRFPKIEGDHRLYLASLGDAHAKVVNVPELLSGSLLSVASMRLAYPTPYFRFFESFADSVHPYLGLAVAKKESTFIAHAISFANAQGIMQLNPETALRMTGGREKNLLHPETNIELGMRHLNELHRQFSGKIPLMLASYNAGEGPVQNWVRRYGTSDWTLWIDLIPYRETRDYVSIVSSYYYWYRRLYEGDPAKAREALP